MKQPQRTGHALWEQGFTGPPFDKEGGSKGEQAHHGGKNDQSAHMKCHKDVTGKTVTVDW